MPCRMDDMPPPNYGSEMQKLREELGNYKAEANKLTRLLCNVSETLERLMGNGVRLQLHPEHKEWWDKHKEADEKRRAKEEKLKQAKEALVKKAAEEKEKQELKEYKRLKKKFEGK